MKHVKKSVLLWYSAREMYALVTAVAAYPGFLPWCEKAEVLQEDPTGMTARLHLQFAGLHHAFTTRNKHITNELVHMELVDGPFSRLDGEWRFVPLGSASPVAGGADAGPQACRVEFELSYEFSSRMLEVAVSPVFDRIANTFVDAFVTRAEQVYGAR